MIHNSRNKLKSFAVLIVLIFLFSVGICPRDGNAKEYFTGKNSEIFKENSVEFINDNILKGIVDSLKEEQGVAKIEITILCTELANNPDNKIKLADARIEALKKYLQSRLTGAQISGSGQTYQVPNIHLNESNQMGNMGPDFLQISATVSDNPSTRGDAQNDLGDDSQPLEPWRQKLLERYKKVEENHRGLCEQEMKRPNQECLRENREECLIPYKGGNDLNYHLCKVKSEKCLTTNNTSNVSSRYIGDDSLEGVEYSLERILKIRETAGEVYAIAKEIAQHSHHNISYDSSKIDNEIKSQELAIKYFRRAVKNGGRALEDIPKYDNGKKNNDTIGSIWTTYNNWMVTDGIAADIHANKTRKNTIEYIKKLHNYVRRNLRLPLLDSNLEIPLCVWTEVYITYLPTLEENERDYQEDIVPNLHELGISEIPLD